VSRGKVRIFFGFFQPVGTVCKDLPNLGLVVGSDWISGSSVPEWRKKYGSRIL
jgi:hypothetical protein